jgi:hypothetical protein
MEKMDARTRLCLVALALGYRLCLAIALFEFGSEPQQHLWISLNGRMAAEFTPLILQFFR